MSTAAKRTAKNPLIGSEISCNRRGNNDLVMLVANRDTPARERVARPPAPPFSR